MKKRQKKLLIEFSPEQTEKYFDIVSKQFDAEANESCLPSGVQVIIDIVPPFGEHASVNGFDLGEINIKFVSV